MGWKDLRAEIAAEFGEYAEAERGNDAAGIVVHREVCNAQQREYRAEKRKDPAWRKRENAYKAEWMRAKYATDEEYRKAKLARHAAWKAEQYANNPEYRERAKRIARAWARANRDPEEHKRKTREYRARLKADPVKAAEVKERANERRRQRRAASKGKQ